jgi:hypothetical protein
MRFVCTVLGRKGFYERQILVNRKQSRKRVPVLHPLQLLNIFDYLFGEASQPGRHQNGGGGGVSLPQNVRVDRLECVLGAAPHDLVWPFHVL